MEIAVKAADEKRSDDITVLDMQGVSLVADYFVITNADSQRQVAAVAENIVEREEEAGNTVDHVEGTKESSWILIDLGDVIVHVFTKEQREFYQIEKLWSDAKQVDVSKLIKA